MLLPRGLEIFGGRLRDERRELPREMKNSCHQEWGEMSSDQPEFFWQIRYLRHIRLSSWATANHSLPVSRARRKMGSLSSARNKRKTNKVTFSHMTPMSDGKGAGHYGPCKEEPPEPGAGSGELLGVHACRRHTVALLMRFLICLWVRLRSCCLHAQNPRPLSSTS